ncbi:MAG: leucine-rich repeat protein, partial [Clostridia bacterium]|nr:leucine-rich repeat protein [Clostridia bacterium]
CDMLEYVVIPSSYTRIEPYAFDYSHRVVLVCDEGSAAQEYAVENEIPYIYEWNYYPYAPSCGYGVYWELYEDTLRIYGQGAIFDNMNWPEEVLQAREVIIGYGVERIGYAAFSNFPELQKVMIESPCSIDSMAFAGCGKLEFVIVLCDDLYMSYDSFKGCNNVIVGQPGSALERYAQEFHIPFANISEIDINHAGICGNGVWYYYHHGYDWDIYRVPTLVISGNGDMYGHVEWKNFDRIIKNIVINEGVHSIGDHAFMNFPEVDLVVIPDSVMYIDPNAFEGMLGFLMICEHGSYAEDYAIEHGLPYMYTEFYDPYTDNICGEGAYCHFDEATETLIIYGSRDVCIDRGIYVTRENVKHIVFSEGITSVEWHIGGYYWGVESIRFPESIERIRNFSFDFQNLKYVFIPALDVEFYSNFDNDIVIVCKPGANFAEYYWGKIIYVYEENFVYGRNYCGNGVYWSFDEAEGTLTVSGQGEMSEYFRWGDGDHFELKHFEYQKDSVEHIVINDGVTVIGRGAFEYFRNVRTVHIAESVEKIGECAFMSGVPCYIFVPSLDTEFEYGNFAPGGILICKPGSTAEQYAKEHRIGYVYEEYYEPDRNYCGNGVYWTFDEAEATLTISGQGEMFDHHFDYNYEDPLYDRVEHIVINDGVTSIGEHSFAFFHNFEKITIPNSVIYISPFAYMHTQTIRCYRGSCAEAYALEHGIPIEYISEGESDLVWFLDDEGTLTVYGKMDDYVLENTAEGYISTAPWRDEIASIKKIVLDDSVDYIG